MPELTRRERRMLNEAYMLAAERSALESFRLAEVRKRMAGEAQEAAHLERLEWERREYAELPEGLK